MKNKKISEIKVKWYNNLYTLYFFSLYFFIFFVITTIALGFLSKYFPNSIYVKKYIVYFVEYFALNFFNFVFGFFSFWKIINKNKWKTDILNSATDYLSEHNLELKDKTEQKQMEIVFSQFRKICIKKMIFNVICFLILEILFFFIIGGICIWFVI